jgi:cell division protease FtsH
VNPNRNRSTIIYVLLFAAIIILVFYSFSQGSSAQETLSINQVAADIQAGKVTRVVEEQDKLTVIYGTGTQAIERIAHKEPETTLVQQLKDLGVTTEQLSPTHISIEYKPPSPWVGILSSLGYIIPFIILGAIFWWVFRQAQGSNNAECSQVISLL